MVDKIIHYDKEKFRKGGIYAALLPLIIGIALAIAPIANGAFNSSFYLWPVIILSFVLVAPIVAISSVRELKRRAPFKRNEIFYVGIAKSSLATFCVAMIYNLFFAGVFIAGVGVSLDSIMLMLGGTFIFGGVMQFIFWLVIIVPLTMLCTMIFENIVNPK